MEFHIFLRYSRIFGAHFNQWGKDLFNKALGICLLLLRQNDSEELADIMKRNIDHNFSWQLVDRNSP
jgi:hypothetical protein